MGLFRKNSRSTYERPRPLSSSSYSLNKPITPNPDPKNFLIVQSKQVKQFLLVLVHYPDCTNYEGNKILLYEDVTLNKLIKQNSLDPHFCNNSKFYSPIARFVPTGYGWNCGLLLIQSLIAPYIEGKSHVFIPNS